MENQKYIRNTIVVTFLVSFSFLNTHSQSYLPLSGGFLNGRLIAGTYANNFGFSIKDDYQGHQ